MNPANRSGNSLIQGNSDYTGTTVRTKTEQVVYNKNTTSAYLVKNVPKKKIMVN